jgi:hypothetical protein
MPAYHSNSSGRARQHAFNFTPISVPTSKVLYKLCVLLAVQRSREAVISAAWVQLMHARTKQELPMNRRQKEMVHLRLRSSTLR